MERSGLLQVIHRRCSFFLLSCLFDCIHLLMINEKKKVTAKYNKNCFLFTTYIIIVRFFFSKILCRKKIIERELSKQQKYGLINRTSVFKSIDEKQADVF